MQESLTKMEVRPGGPGVLILTCHGDLSWEDREQLSACVERHFADTADVNGVIMDLSQVEHVNSAGLGALFQLTRLLRGRGGALVLANASDMLVRVFRTIGLDRLARISESVQSAAETLAARGDTDEIRLLPESDHRPADPRYGPNSGDTPAGSPSGSGENRRGSRRTEDLPSPLEKEADRC